MDAPKTASTQAPDGVSAPPSPTLMPFPSACSSPVSSNDIIAVEKLRQASAGRGGDRPGKYGFYGDPDSRSAALAASQAAMEEGHASSASPASRATFSVEQSHDTAEESQEIPLIHVNWPGSAEHSNCSSGHLDGLQTPPRFTERPRSGSPTPDPSAAPYSSLQKQEATGMLSAPRRPRCCMRCPKPFTVFVASLVVALVLIAGFMVGHFAAPYIQTMTFMQPVGAMAPSLAPQQSQIAMAGVLRVRG